ncbi:restriction endonuclease subunit S [Escherichia coli]|nr:restriction endonuclease subunit S [Escherichia coli]MBU5667639.1 restriction endonuclease subunit S [Enterobacteriaceae bacterium S32_ASV_15]EJX3028661.1 restriction endonuclease subunit S [Escherichia coli]MBI0808952.1 restriction endonuclease subunit S [Escherichia coli]HBA2831282.1 restriction endonuclease subunit S [Escherichia coli]
MSFELYEYKIEDLGKVITGKTPPSKISDAFSAQGIPFVTPKDMDGRRLIDKTERYLSSQGVEAVRNCLLPQNSIAVSCIGSDMGKTVLLPGESITNQQINAIVVDSEHFDYKYVYYYLSTLQDDFKAIAGGSATPILNKGHFSQFKVSLPVKPVQNKIALILDSLDTKIEVNTEINHTLEQMAQALFKSWFVDFEPVKAKMAMLEAGGSQEDATLAAMTVISGKDSDALVVFEREHPEQYAELKATAELFPSAMQDSELGEIPAGWRTAIVESVINRLKVKNTFPADCIKLFGQHPVLEQGAKIYQGYHDEEPSFNASLQSPMFIFGDHTCVMHLSTVPFDISKNTLVLKGKIFNTYWTFFALKGKQKFQEYKRHWSDLKVKQVVIPDENNGLLLTNYFASKCENLFGLLEQNRKQNLILQNTRDTLLPKLLSGEITLPEAEQIISEEA